MSATSCGGSRAEEREKEPGKSRCCFFFSSSFCLSSLGYGISGPVCECQRPTGLLLAVSLSLMRAQTQRQVVLYGLSSPRFQEFSKPEFPGPISPLSQPDGHTRIV